MQSHTATKTLSHHPTKNLYMHDIKQLWRFHCETIGALQTFDQRDAEAENDGPRQFLWIENVAKDKPRSVEIKRVVEAAQLSGVIPCDHVW